METGSRTVESSRNKRDEKAKSCIIEDNRQQCFLAISNSSHPDLSAAHPSPAVAGRTAFFCIRAQLRRRKNKKVRYTATAAPLLVSDIVVYGKRDKHIALSSVAGCLLPACLH